MFKKRFVLVLLSLILAVSPSQSRAVFNNTNCTEAYSTALQDSASQIGWLSREVIKPIAMGFFGAQILSLLTQQRLNLRFAPAAAALSWPILWAVRSDELKSPYRRVIDLEEAARGDHDQMHRFQALLEDYIMKVHPTRIKHPKQIQHKVSPAARAQYKEELRDLITEASDLGLFCENGKAMTYTEVKKQILSGRMKERIKRAQLKSTVIKLTNPE